MKAVCMLVLSLVAVAPAVAQTGTAAVTGVVQGQPGAA